MNERELLNAAADTIEERGLCKHTMHGPGGTICTVGAINHGVIGKVNGFDILCSALAALEKHLGVERIASEWNDLDDTTQNDVVQTLRKVAATFPEETAS